MSGNFFELSPSNPNIDLASLSVEEIKITTIESENRNELFRPFKIATIHPNGDFSSYFLNPGAYLPATKAESIADVNRVIDNARYTVLQLPEGNTATFKICYEIITKGDDTPSSEKPTLVQNIIPITVFISYSWDSDQHKKWVLSLANDLAGYGIYVKLDQYDLHAGEDMPHYMERSVEESDKVIIILTPNYKIKADNRRGGVGYEHSIITQEIFSQQTHNRKFVPVVKQGDFSISVPTALKSKVYVEADEKTEYKTFFNQLLHELFDEPLVKRPPLGNKRLNFKNSNDNLIQTPSYLNTDETIIDIEASKIKCKMPQYSLSRLNFIITSLSEKDTNTLYNLYRDSLIKQNGYPIPNIFADQFRKSISPQIEHYIPLENYHGISNHFIEEGLVLIDNRITYEFAEFHNHDMTLINLLNLSEFFLHFMIMLKKVHDDLKISPQIEFQVNLSASNEVMLYRPYLPFDFTFRMETYSLPQNSLTKFFTFDNIDKEIIFNVFEKIYSGFISKNVKSMNPIAKINKQEVIARLLLYNL